MTNKRIKWHIEKRKINDLKPYDKNPRIITELGLKELKRSFDEIGFAQPININTDNTILSGHARCIQLKNEDPNQEVDVYVPDRKLTPKQEEAVIVRMNKNVAGTWDFDILANNFEIDDLLEWGFTEDELQIEQLPEVEGLTDPDEVPEVEHPISTKGDIWILGNHRVMCGDSTMIDDVEKLMNGEKAGLVITDPPYNVAVNDESKASLKARNRRSDGLKIKNDKMSEGDFNDFLLKVFSNYYLSVLEGGSIYVFYTDSMTIPFMTNFMDAGFHFAQNCIWNKQRFVMTRKDYHYKHEPVLYGWKKGTRHSWHSDRKQTSVWNFDKPFRNDLHPTMKPIDLLEYPLQNSSSIGSLVLDLFLGSGSTLIACEKANRKCYGMELDEKYCDVIINRWQDFTGKSAILESTGKTYKEMRSERAK